LAVLKDARKAADAIEDRRWKAETLRAIGEAQAKGGGRTTAAQTFQDAIKGASDLVEPFKRQTLANIAISQAESGDLKRARQTLESVEDEGTHKGALVRIAGAQARAGDAKGALLIAGEVPVNWKDSVLRAVALVQAEVGKAEEAAQTVGMIED